MATNNWSNGPNLSTERYDHGCFSIKDSNITTQIVVMGGHGSGPYSYLSSTEILDVNSMTWRTGPALPISVSGNSGVRSEVRPYLGFSTGGYGNGQQQRKVYGLKKTNGNSLKWEEVHGMTTGRSWHSIVNAPKSLLPNC